MQLTERRQGNENYRAGDLDGALHHYERALAIVEYVRGTSEADQVNRIMSIVLDRILRHNPLCHCLGQDLPLHDHI